MSTPCSTPQSLFSSSFTTHSSHSLEQIAARVIKEFSNESNPDFEEDYNSPCAEIGGIDSYESSFQEEFQNEDDEEQEFEFPLISRDLISCPSPGDEIFYNGGILPKYPLFNTNLLLEAEVIMGKNYKKEETRPPPAKVIRLPLRMLFEEEREKPEFDELNGIPTETYCVWKPKRMSDSESEEERWNKSSSNGLSKRWKWPDLIHRSGSDGSKDRFVFLTPVKGENKIKEKKVEQVEKSKVAEKDASVEQHAEYGGEKRRSLLPHRLDLVGFFSKGNGLSWS